MASNGKLTEPQVKVGDRVKFKDYAGNEVKIEGKFWQVSETIGEIASFERTLCSVTFFNLLSAL